MPSLTESLRGAGVVLTIAVAWHVHRSPPGEVSIHSVAEHGAMIGAMMLPLAASSALLVAERSLRRRRRRAVAEHVGGFVLLWVAFGMCAAAGVSVLQDVVPRYVALAGLTAAAAAWQVSNRRRVTANRCGYVRAGPPTGWRSDLHTVAAGSRHALPCLRSCGAAMAAMVAAPHPLVMLAMFAAYLSEWMPGANPFGAKRSSRPAPVYAAFAAGAALAAVA